VPGVERRVVAGQNDDELGDAGRQNVCERQAKELELQNLPAGEDGTATAGARE